MAKLARMSELVGQIYEAALDARAWPTVLLRLLALVDATAAVLIVRDLQRGKDSLDCRVGAQSPGWSPLLAREPPARPLGVLFAVPEPPAATQLFGIVLERSAGRMAALYLHQPHGSHAQRATARVLQPLAPHLRQALRIGRRVQVSESMAASLCEGLDRLGIAVLVLDAAGRLLQANRAGLLRLSDGDVVHWVDGLPQPRDPVGAAQLQAVLARQSASGAASILPGQIGVPPRVIGRSGEQLKLHVLALCGPCITPRGAPEATALLLIAQQAPDLAVRMREAADRYGLTPAEARVVKALIGGCTIERGAQLLGVRPATVKTHLQHVFDKTAARRQVDLVKLIAEPAPPVGGAGLGP